VIVVDTSALFAIILEEAEAKRCESVMMSEPDIMISAGTMAEALVVADGRKVGSQMRTLFSRFELNIIPLTKDRAEWVGDVYRQWGKGNHAAGLNFGDCFAYALAKEFACPLLFIGNDFARTDVMKILPG
jgi:ribonuclease VapC